jgi:hypothetical protein
VRFHAFQPVLHSLLNLHLTAKVAASVALHSHVAIADTLASHHIYRHGTLKIANGTVPVARCSIAPPVGSMGI